MNGLIELRDYQLAAKRRTYAALRSHRRVCLVLPTGAGKTVTGAAMVQDAIRQGKRVLWLAHRTELIDQTVRALMAFGLVVGAVAASSCYAPSPDAPVQVASIQTLLARDHRPDADLIIWDEAHHGPAAEWSQLLDAYPNAKVIGLTATPERSDGSGLGATFDELVVGVTVRQLTEAGHLVPCEVSRPPRLLEAGQLAREPLVAYQEDAPGQQGFLFARSVSEAQRYAAEFTAAGINSVAVHAKTHPDERAANLELFKQGVVRMLCNVYVFTEGTDLPMASCCILARGASTAGIFLQMVGRVLRPHRSKKNAMLIDLRGITWIWRMPEDEREYHLTGKAISLVEKGLCKVCRQPTDGYPCQVCGYIAEMGEAPLEQRDEITNDPMVRYRRFIAQGPEQRFETLVRWIQAIDIKKKTDGTPHKRSSVRFKWKHVYQEDLSAAEFERACAYVDTLQRRSA